MDRKLFLSLCRSISMMPGGVSGTKKDVPLELRVNFNDIWYYPIGYKLTFDNLGLAVHTAILHDLNANTIIECKLNEVKEFIKNET